MPKSLVAASCVLELRVCIPMPIFVSHFLGLHLSQASPLIYIWAAPALSWGRYCPGWRVKDTEGLHCLVKLCMVNHSIFTFDEDYCPYLTYRETESQRNRNLNGCGDRQNLWTHFLSGGNFGSLGEMPQLSGLCCDQAVLSSQACRRLESPGPLLLLL